MITRRFLPAVVLAVAVAGCGNDAPVAEDPTPQPVTTVGQGSEPAPEEPTDAVREYMEAIASFDPGEMRASLDLTAKGSAANAYMQFKIAQTEALLDGGLSGASNPGDLSRAGDGYELCIDGDCTTFGGFTADEGLLADLEVDGEPPGPRLTLGNGETVESSGITAELLVAYEAITISTLAVILSLETDDRSAEPFLYSAIYRAPDGAQRTATDAWGPLEIGANSHATVMLSFDHVEPGGQLTLEGCTGDCSADFTISVQVG